MKNLLVDLNTLKSLLFQGVSMAEIASKFKVGKTTIQNYVKKLNLSQEEIETVKALERSKRAAKIRKNGIGQLSKEVRDADRQTLLLKISELTKLLESRKVEPFDSSVSTIYKGVAAELYAQYRLMRAGIEVFKAPHYLKATDLLVIKEGKLIRCEVKATARGREVGIYRTNFNSKDQSFTPHRYEQGELDFFILVLLEFEEIFIVPYQETLEKGKAITLSPNSAFWKYLNRFDLLK